MNGPIQHVVILGGGTAGWLTAGILAAEHLAADGSGLKVTLIESPDIKPIGVGEGTWPTMRSTLLKIGVSETDFFRYCDASFKQGIKFSGWVDGSDQDAYYHPLELPMGFNQIDLAGSWQFFRDDIKFADAVCFQNILCDRNLAPKQLATPEYAAVANYAYHFSAEKLGAFLHEHCVKKLGVEYVSGSLHEVKVNASGDIACLALKGGKEVNGDLFVDCSGANALLLGKHFNIPLKSQKHILFNDTALAVQVPYPSQDSPIASVTHATAQTNGWIWDIGLPSRKGVGHVYASEFTSEEAATEQLQRYIAQSLGQQKADSLSIRKIQYEPGYREKFWHKNCVAIGMSGGFVEPLEATALVMIEAAATLLSVDLPSSRLVMDAIARRFNHRFNYYWQTTIDFLKLQYHLTNRTDSEYWRENSRSETLTESLAELLSLWRYQTPNRIDFPLAEEMLPAASWQYILYGMRFETLAKPTTHRKVNAESFARIIEEVKGKGHYVAERLPSNRDLINDIIEKGLSRP